jgi:general secretion pathway protein L
MDNVSADLRQWMRDLAHRFGLPAFWQWWMGQLAPLVPRGTRAAVKRRLLRPVLAFAHDSVVVWEPRTSDGALAYAVSARVPLQGEAAAVLHAGRAAIEALPRVAYGIGPAMTKVVVALPPGQVLRKTLMLPVAVAQDLKQTLAYDLDRHTPFKPDELHFDAVVVARDAQRGLLKVDWAAALRTAVADARRRAESWGATVVSVTPDSPGSAGPPTTAGSRLNLLPESERPAVAWWRRWRRWVPLAAVGVLALAAILLPIWQKRGYVIALSQTTEQARLQAEAASGLRLQLETMTGDYNYVLGRKYAFPSAVQVLDDVTKVLPDDTWLTQLEVKSAAKGKEPRRDLLLRGETNNAGRLVSLLEESKAFIEAAPRSPTTKIQPGTGEIFDLGAQVKPIPPPPPLQFASAPSDAAAPAPIVTGVPPAAPITAVPAPADVAPAASAAPVAPPPAPPIPDPDAPPPAFGPPAAAGSPPDAGAGTIVPTGQPRAGAAAAAPATQPAAPPPRRQVNTPWNRSSRGGGAP